MSDQDEVATVKKKQSPEKNEVAVDIKIDKDTKKPDKKGEEDPKPRIVLTFRTEKPGAKSSSMKIVSTEEKIEDVSPRRSNRTKTAKWEMEDEKDISPKKDKVSQPASENDETSDSSHTTLKRSTRRRSKEFSDNVIANAIARKEKSYNETPTPTQRLSRRIKPTAKVLANKELRIGVESQNNARLGITPEKSPEEGVRTRRSTRRISVEANASVESAAPPEKKNLKRTFESQEKDIEDVEDGQNVKKLRHLCGLGLKAIEKDDTVEEENKDEELDENEEEELEEEEDLDDDSEARMYETGSFNGSDYEYLDAPGAVPAKCPRRSGRLCSTYDAQESEDRSSPTEDDKPRRRSPRKLRNLDYNLDYYHHMQRYCKDIGRTETDVGKSKTSEQLSVDSDAADGDAGLEAASPEEEGSRIIATCYCDTPSNIYADPADLIEPVFCQAVESVGGVRVGCSHGARREGDGLAALLRAGPRTPYRLLCSLHYAQHLQHMCCAACGLFCSQGTFYQCSKGHLFHLECGLALATEGKRAAAGCPHCGVRAPRWLPAARDAVRVRVDMRTSNKMIFLPDQRVQCTPAYLGFSSLKSPAPLGVPEALLPCAPLSAPLPATGGCFDKLLEAIERGDSVQAVLEHLSLDLELSQPLESYGGGSLVHAAAARGHAAALYVLHAAGANLDAMDNNSRTPLIIAVTAHLDKKELQQKEEEEMEVDKEEKEDDKEDTKTESEDKYAETSHSGNHMGVIQYLVAAGCDVDMAGPEGMTALHVAAQLGGARVCGELLARARVAPRDHGGWTPLVWAAENKHHRVVRLLLAEGADPSAADNEGNQPIHWCTLAGDARSLQLLLDAAPDAVAAPNRHTDTPLHVAARQGHFACVVILLARGARTDVVNSAGELPVDVCSGDCRATISLNMQMAVLRGTSKYKLLFNDISRGRESVPIPCVNEIDEQWPPPFTYVTQHVQPKPLAIDNSIATLQGCDCSDDKCELGSCACCVLGVRRWWTRGRLARDFPYHEPPMLFECNHTCACDLKQCTNSVVTRASRAGATFVRASVFRTARRGWGLRAGARVAAGTPVAAYCGELLSAADADTRTPDQYMFSLDVKPDLLEQCEDKTQLCVDAANYGSAARFINHSCSPNLAPVRVFTSTRDLRLPTVVLFAIRDIKSEEEFTFDYGDKFWSVKSKWMNCECGSTECRYPTKSEETESS